MALQAQSLAPTLRVNAVAPGPRSVQWRADAPATLVWAEAQADNVAVVVPRRPDLDDARIGRALADVNAGLPELADLADRLPPADVETMAADQATVHAEGQPGQVQGERLQSELFFKALRRRL